MKVIGIAAVSRNGTIGKNGKLPWQLPNDLKHFKDVTYGSWVIMGYATYKSIGCPLSNRTNVVITKRPFDDNGVIQVSCIEEAIDIALDEGVSKIYVIGGAKTYSKAKDYIIEWDLTIIDANIEGDCQFPINLGDLNIVSREDHLPDEKHQYPYSFRIYRPKVSIDLI